MKKLLPALMLLGCLFACSAPQVQSVPMETLFPAVSQPPDILYALSYNSQEESMPDEDGLILATASAQLPVLTALRSDGTPIDSAENDAESQALAAAQTFNEAFSPWFSSRDLEELSSMSAEERAWKEQEGIPWDPQTNSYAVSLTCAAYQTRGLISVEGTYYSNTGGAHPNSWLLGWNFDLEAGEFISPLTLADDSVAFQEAVTEEIIRQIEQIASDSGQPPSTLFWDDYAQIVADWSNYAVYFSDEGMQVAFSPYDIAAYAAGPQIFSFSYDWLQPYLSAYGQELLRTDQ